MGYFKDITDILSKKYPNRKVFVISDQHFDHRNIIKYTRNELFDSSDIDTSVKLMNDYIIENHNKVVGNDDIVIMLGDFSFKNGIDRLSELTSKLNGHKYLIMGNHDYLEKPDFYLKAGFEDVFFFPVKFNDDYFSHYPLNASIESWNRPNTVLYNYLCNEFKKNNYGINYHGHQHSFIDNGTREKNVACELIDYKPVFVGMTKSSSELNIIDKPFLDDEFFDIIHEIMSRFNNYQENDLITDYLYTILLDVLTLYKEQIIAFGSVMLNKKYNFNFNVSDLDVTKLFDSKSSIQTNRNSFKKFGNEIYEKIVKINGFNPDFYKKIDFICILSFIYASHNSRFKGYLDMNILLDDFYKSDDFIVENGSSLVEQLASKVGISKPNNFKYPKFSIQTTNKFADIVNCFLQYIYTTDPEKKALALKKTQKIIDKVDFSTQIDFDKLQNMLIRYLLRNIYFYESCGRKKESDLVLINKKIDIPDTITKNSEVGDMLGTIVNSSDYINILELIQDSNNKKKEITYILKYYK